MQGRRRAGSREELATGKGFGDDSADSRNHRETSLLPKDACDTGSLSIPRSREVIVLTRRAVVGKFVAGAALAVAGSGSKTAGASQGRAAAEVPPTGELSRNVAPLPEQVPSASSASDDALQDNGPAPWALLRPLQVGSAVACGWHVAGLTEVSNGSCVLTLQNEHGRNHRVHLCRNDGRPQGLVYTEHLDLLVMNGGQGDLPTDEGLAQAVAQISHVLASNETHQQPVVVALLPHAERLRMFASGEHARLR